MIKKNQLVVALLLLVTLMLTACAQLETEDQVSPASTETPEITPIVRIDLADAYDAYQEGSALFLDVRDARSFDQQKIPGSVNVPLIELSQRLSELNPEDRIIAV